MFTMLRSSYLSFVIFLTFVLAGCSQNAAPPDQQKLTEGAAQFNSELASELGADEYGMRSYVMVVLKTGPMDSKITDAEARAEIFSGHFSNMTKLAEAKKARPIRPLYRGRRKTRALYFQCPDTRRSRETRANRPCRGGWNIRARIHKILRVRRAHANSRRPQDHSENENIGNSVEC